MTVLCRNDPYLGRELQRYFPKVMQNRFGDAIENHRLRREIIATQLSNAIVNRGGATVIARLVDETGADGATIAAAYATVRETFDTIGLNQALDSCDNRIAGDLQLSLYAQVQDLTLNRIAWFIRHVDFGDEPLEAIITRFRNGIAGLRDSLETTLPEASLKLWRDNARALAGKDVDPRSRPASDRSADPLRRSGYRADHRGDRAPDLRDREHLFRGRRHVQAQRTRGAGA